MSEKIELNEKKVTEFQALSTMKTLDVFKRGFELKSMPCIEKRELPNHGGTAEVLWLPTGFSKEYPQVRFAWLSPRASELQRNENIKPTDEFVTRTILTIQKNLDNNSIGATITLEGMQKGATMAATASLDDWANV